MTTTRIKNALEGLRYSWAPTEWLSVVRELVSAQSGDEITWWLTFGDYAKREEEAAFPCRFSGRSSSDRYVGTRGILEAI